MHPPPQFSSLSLKILALHILHPLPSFAFPCTPYPHLISRTAGASRTRRTAAQTRQAKLRRRRVTSLDDDIPNEDGDMAEGEETLRCYVWTP
ncbi:hypothetical protein HYPSUDRAFT_36175 [Hypholoma sublateritium FD-334 SS-4]|uniref:Secreted protein n=1 Tax=Hypholoma sublateritium (strain FD-334 SS-4) TaxID=945553 RepID=A0A0D2Q4E2_HYPSF|nr:hypothetical protein HYPSUDRAFT_36175 [Hypholoma sublateritium FD-334 SS-4]